MPNVPNTVNDTVVYAPRYVYTAEDVLLDVDEGSRLDIYGDVYLNGSRITGGPGFDVRAYGAVGDGITDDRTAVAAAITACNAANGGTIVFPQGNYKINSALPVISKCTMLIGGGAGIPGYTAAVTTLTFAAGVPGLVIQGITAHGSSVSNLLLKSLSTIAGTDDGISLRCGYCRIQDVVIDGFGRYGVNQDSTDGTNINMNHLDKVHAYRSKVHGFYIKGTNSNCIKLIGCTATENVQWGFYVDQSSSCVFIAPNGDRNVVGDFYDNGGSNQYYDLYSEGGGKFTAGPNSMYGTLVCGNNGMPVVSLAAGTPALTWSVRTKAEWMRQIRVGPMPGDTLLKTYKFATATPNWGDFSLINETNAQFIWQVDSTSNNMTVNQKLITSGEIQVNGALNHDGTTVGFYNTTPVAKQTGVAVTIAAVHAALVSLGLIS